MNKPKMPAALKVEGATTTETLEHFMRLVDYYIELKKWHEAAIRYWSGYDDIDFAVQQADARGMLPPSGTKTGATSPCRSFIPFDHGGIVCACCGWSLTSHKVEMGTVQPSPRRNQA